MRCSQRIIGVMVALTIVASSILVSTSAVAANWRQRQWYVDALKIPQAQSVTRGQGIVVAVIDSGVDSRTSSLTGQLLPGKSFGLSGSADGSSDTGKDGHGTSMAGIIAGTGDSPDGYLGIAPGGRILPVAAAAEDGYLASAIRWAADHGASVINISSTGSGSGSSWLKSAIRYALDKDVVVVAAAGNTDGNGYDVGSPANIPGVVAVSGTERNSDAWDGSSKGAQVAISAPALDVLAPVPTTLYPEGYGSRQGTSPATAIVSGVVALIRSKYPELDAPNSINRLLRTAKDQGRPGRDEHFGFGTVRAYDALTRPVQAVQANPLGMPPSPKPAPPTVSAKKGAGVSGPAVAVIAVGVVVVLGVGILLVVLARRRRSPRN